MQWFVRSAKSRMMPDGSNDQQALSTGCRDRLGTWTLTSDIAVDIDSAFEMIDRKTSSSAWCEMDDIGFYDAANFEDFFSSTELCHTQPDHGEAMKSLAATLSLRHAIMGLCYDGVVSLFRPNIEHCSSEFAMVAGSPPPPPPPPPPTCYAPLYCSRGCIDMRSNLGNPPTSFDFPRWCRQIST